MEEENFSQPKSRKKLYAGGVLALFILFMFYLIYLPHSSFRGAREIEIIPGMGSRKIGELLKKESTINSKWAFVTYASVKGQASDLKPGIYTFTDNMDVPEIVRMLVRGVSNESIVTIPEGWTTGDIAEYLAEKKLVSMDNFKKIAGAPYSQKFNTPFPFLQDRPAAVGLEGFLFPDTYRIYKNSSEEDIVLKMLENFAKKITPEMLTEIAGQKKTIFQVITMSSLIEKEVVSTEDRALISGILWKRLDKKIPLQVDATITFIKSERLGAAFPGQDQAKISLEDTKIDSPYNTYKYRGLPLGPISNPGLSAIKAAIYPQDSPYFYYLSAPDGTTIFSKTLGEHKQAKLKYLK